MISDLTKQDKCIRSRKAEVFRQKNVAKNLANILKGESLQVYLLFGILIIQI